MKLVFCRPASQCERITFFLKGETTMKRILSLILLACFALTASAFAEAVDPYGPVADETVKITVGRAESANILYDEGENSADNYIVRYLEEKLNVDYEYAFSVDDSAYVTKVNMAIASNEIPDVMNVNYTQLTQLVEAGAIEDMTDAFNTYASESLKKCFDSTNGITLGLGTFDGRLMGIGDICPGMDSVPVLWIRADWLRQCNLEEPKTWDDVMAVARAFLEQNPSGSVNTGIAVCSNIVQPNGGNYRLDAMFHYFGAFPQQWIYDAEGKLVYGSITEETRQALGAIAQLVNDGVINASLAVMDDNQCYELIANDQCGMFFGSWWGGQWPVVSIMGGRPDDVEFKPLLVMANPETGKFDVCGKNPTNTFIVVKKGCSEDVKEAVVKTINYQYDLDQAQAEGVRPNGMDSNFSWHYYPINVLHCDYDAKEIQIAQVMDVIDGKMAYDDLSGDGKTWYNGYTTVLNGSFREAYDTNQATANAWGWAVGALCVESAGDQVNMFPEASYAETPSMEKLWTAMETLEEEYFLKVITGEASLDGWDDFVSEWKSLGGDKITAEMEQYIAENK